MTSEVSRYEIESLRTAHERLENRVRDLAEELRAADLRHFRQTCEMEPRLAKWSTIFFALSVAFTLFVGISVGRHTSAGTETAAATKADEGPGHE